MVTTSGDGVRYNSREAAGGRPLLILTLTENNAPVVNITSPPSGTTVLPTTPVTLIGTRDIQKAKSLVIAPGKMRMVIHPAIEVSGEDDPETIRELMTETRQAIASSLPPEFR